MAINTWTFHGNIGQNAETKQVGDTTVTTFSVAISEKYTDKADGQRKTSTTWVRCSIWKNDKIGQYLLKGTHVVIQGVPKATAYLDKEGKAQSSLECIVRQVEFAGSSKSESSDGNNGGGGDFSSDDFGDLPF